MTKLLKRTKPLESAHRPQCVCQRRHAMGDKLVQTVELPWEMKIMLE